MTPIQVVTTWGAAAMVPSLEQETNAARNTREFFAHRKLVLARIMAALKQRKHDKHDTNKSRLR